MASLGWCFGLIRLKRYEFHRFTVTISASRVFKRVIRVSRVKTVRVEVRVSVKIRVSLVLVIGWHKTSRRGVSRVETRCVGTAVVTTRGKLRKVLFLALSVTSLFVYEMSREPLRGFAPNSQGRRVWSLARTSLNVKVEGQGLQGQKTAFLALSAACVRFVFGKTSLASS